MYVVEFKEWHDGPYHSCQRVHPRESMDLGSYPFQETDLADFYKTRSNTAPE